MTAESSTFRFLWHITRMYVHTYIHAVRSHSRGYRYYRLSRALRYQEGAQQTLCDCATRPIPRKSAPVSADDAYQGQIRMDRPISSSPSSARVPSTSSRDSAVLRRSRRQSPASCRSDQPRDIAQMQRSVVSRRRKRTQSVKVESAASVFSKEHRDSVSLRSLPVTPWQFDFDIDKSTIKNQQSYGSLRDYRNLDVWAPKMRIIFVKFREISQKYPIVRGMASYSIIWPTACLLQQKITGKEEFNYAEAARFSLYGSLYIAPTLYCWLRCASYFWPKANLKSAITKALVEQVTYSPAAICSFFFGMSLLELKPISACIDEVKIKFWPTYKVAICIWPILQTVNFSLIPERNRVVYVSVCSLVWTCFLAYMKAREAKRKQKELVDVNNVNPKMILESKAQTNERSGHMQIPLLR